MRSTPIYERPRVSCPLCQSPRVTVWPAAVELNVLICECGECHALFSVSPNPDRRSSTFLNGGDSPPNKSGPAT